MSSIVENSKNYVVVALNGVHYVFSYDTLIATGYSSYVVKEAPIPSKTTSKHLNKYLAMRGLSGTLDELCRKKGAKYEDGMLYVNDEKIYILDEHKEMVQGWLQK